MTNQRKQYTSQQAPERTFKHKQFVTYTKTGQRGFVTGMSKHGHIRVIINGKTSDYNPRNLK